MALTELSKEVIAADATMAGAAIIAVAIRLYINYKRKIALHIDDYLIIVALLPTVALCMVGVWAGAIGLAGESYLEMSKPRVSTLLKVNFADVVILIAVAGITKASILMFYRRIFKSRGFEIVVWGMLGLVVAFSVSMIIAMFLVMDPIWMWWYYSDSYHPIWNRKTKFDFQVYLLAGACINMALDLAILTLPVPMIKRLHMNRRKKISLIAVFGTGAFCVVAATLRIYWSNQFRLLVAFKIPFSRTTEIRVWNSKWAHIEAGCAIIAACLPTFAPLITHSDIFFGGVQKYMSRYYNAFTGRSSQRSKDSSGSSQTGEYNTTSEAAANKGFTESSGYVTKSVGTSASDEESLEPPKGQGIQVVKTYGLEYEQRK